jgi:hypothetical protein
MASSLNNVVSAVPNANRHRTAKMPKIPDVGAIIFWIGRHWSELPKATCIVPAAITFATLIPLGIFCWAYFGLPKVVIFFLILMCMAIEQRSWLSLAIFSIFALLYIWLFERRMWRRNRTFGPYRLAGHYLQIVSGPRWGFIRFFWRPVQEEEEVLEAIRGVADHARSVIADYIPGGSIDIPGQPERRRVVLPPGLRPHKWAVLDARQKEWEARWESVRTGNGAQFDAEWETKRKELQDFFHPPRNDHGGVDHVDWVNGQLVNYTNRTREAMKGLRENWRGFPFPHTSKYTTFIELEKLPDELQRKWNYDGVQTYNNPTAPADITPEGLVRMRQKQEMGRREAERNAKAEREAIVKRVGAELDKVLDDTVKLGECFERHGRGHNTATMQKQLENIVEDIPRFVEEREKSLIIEAHDLVDSRYEGGSAYREPPRHDSTDTTATGLGKPFPPIPLTQSPQSPPPGGLMLPRHRPPRAENWDSVEETATGLHRTTRDESSHPAVLDLIEEMENAYIRTGEDEHGERDSGNDLTTLLGRLARERNRRLQGRYR